MRSDAARSAIPAYNDLCRHHLAYAKSARSGVPGLVLSAWQSTAENTSTDKIFHKLPQIISAKLVGSSYFISGK